MHKGGFVTSVVHMTTVHPRDDIRIFNKECLTLVSSGYSVDLLVADGKGDNHVDGVDISDIGKGNSRLYRFLISTYKLYRAALKRDADIYHFHDPELIFIGVLLRRKKKVVVFDAHEDLPSQILSKHYIPKPVRKPLSLIMQVLERFLCPSFSAIVCATSHIEEKFSKFNKTTVTVSNYPLLSVYKNQLLAKNTVSKPYIIYAGAINEIRGIRFLIEAMTKVKSDVDLVVCGTVTHNATDFENSVKESANIRFLGQLQREELEPLLAQAKAGVVTFLPVPNHINSQPNKLFEYMSFGLPVICSNFELWQEVVNGNNCGVCVAPDSAEEIARAIDKVVLDQSMATVMGNNGKVAVETTYNWKIESSKLQSLYESLTLECRG